MSRKKIQEKGEPEKTWNLISCIKCQIYWGEFERGVSRGLTMVWRKENADTNDLKQYAKKKKRHLEV